MQAQARRPSSAEVARSNPAQTILFQGDSITDAGRNGSDHAANSQPRLGNGYAWLAAAQLLVDRPDDDLKIYNRGISGNKVYQLAERWQADCLDLKPDVLSILIGVNDFWHKMKHSYNGTLEKYETDYRALLQRTKDALPEREARRSASRLSFAAGRSTTSGFPEFDGYRAAARHVAEAVGRRVRAVPIDVRRGVEDRAARAWAADGVHPTADGAALMAHAWRQAVESP